MRPIVRRLALAGAVLTGVARPTWADDLSGYVELSASSSTSDTDTLGERSERETTSLRPRLNVVWTHRFFPYVQAQSGVLYELFEDRIRQSGFEEDFETTRFRPFARLTLRSPQLLGDIGWDRNEETTQTGDLEERRLTRDTFLTTAGWYPVELPSARLEFSHVEQHDGTRQLVDRTDNALRFTSEYSPVESTRIYYRGSLERTEDEIEGSKFRTMQHNGQVYFSDIYLDNRWEVQGSWNTTYRNTRIESAGNGELVVPVLPVGGSFDLDATPETGTLSPVPLLVDANTLVGTQINLGLVAPGGDNRPRNFAVDLGIPRDISVLRIWVDRSLPFEISSSFTWEIWTSVDAQSWTRVAVLPTAPFGPFDNRFELRFPGFQARHVKVVVPPLAPTVTNATSFPTILVTELEPLLAQPANEFARTVSDTRHLAQANSRFRLLARYNLYLETTYSLITSDRGTRTWTLSNGVSVRHQFDPIWGVSARVAREDGEDRNRERSAYVYSAAVTADPWETLRYSLVFSGYVDDTGGITTVNRGLNFNTTALVYEGVDLNLLVGTSYNETADGLNNEAFVLGAGATVVPYRTVTITLRYDDRDATISQEGAPDRDDRTRSIDAGIAYNPVPAVYLYGSRRMEERTSQPDRTVDTFAGSWSPFPGGALQVNVSYTETRYSDLDEVDTSFVPFVRWNINPRSYFEIAYQALTRESDVIRMRDDIITSTLRFGF